MEQWLPIIPVFLFHLGARHIVFDLTDVQKNLFRQPVVQAIILMSMFFVSTKSLTLALLLTVLYYIAINILLHEGHSYSAIPLLEKVGLQLRVSSGAPPITPSAGGAAPNGSAAVAAATMSGAPKMF